MVLPVIRLAARRNSLHPWIYARMIRHPGRRPEPGTLVEVVSKEGAFIGRGFYNGHSRIGIRLLSEDPAEAIDEAFFRERLRRALHLRTEVLRIGEVSDAFRWVHAEADGLSGLVVDRYADLVVIEPYSAGYQGPLLEMVVEALRALSGGATIAVRPDAGNEQREHTRFAEAARRYPCPAGVSIREHRLRVDVDLKTGRKTGFFLDQRDNRARLAEIARGAEVVDAFCYTGGFALSALLGGARSALGIDLDADALRAARRNASKNGVEPRFEQADVFDVFRRMKQEGAQVDILVIDPARLAAIKEEIPAAQRKYHDLNRMGMELVRDGGLLVSCSCTGLISEAGFLSILTRAAAEAQRQLQVFAVTGAAGDHPWSTPFPEGRYLKAVFARVLPLPVPSDRSHAL